MGGTVFVSGIDTGVGKTVVTGLMARFLLERGMNAATIKLVQTGNTGFSEDRDEHRRFMGKTLPEDAENLTAPQIFAFPASPHLAAKLENRVVDVEKTVKRGEARLRFALTAGHTENELSFAARETADVMCRI